MSKAYFAAKTLQIDAGSTHHRSHHGALRHRQIALGHLGPGEGTNDRPLASPGVTGGDRARDYERSTGDGD